MKVNTVLFIYLFILFNITLVDANCNSTKFCNAWSNIGSCFTACDSQCRQVLSVLVRDSGCVEGDSFPCAVNFAMLRPVVEACPLPNLNCEAPIINSCTNSSTTNCTCCGRGKATNSTCKCAPGFSGVSCEVSCNGRGTFNLTSLSCECNPSPQITGRYCEIECGGHGTFNNSTRSCQCDAFSSLQSNTCIECGGKGRVITENGQQKCLCEPYYSGAKCQDLCSGGQNQIDPASTNICVCSSITMGGSACNLPCSGHGTTRDGTSCLCERGYSGLACQVECSGRGAVVNGVCDCLGNVFSGDMCEIECNDHGEAVHLSVCQCEQSYDWNGTHCVRALCSGNYVRSRDGGCVCSSLYGGPNCELLCSGHGTFNGSVCVCDMPYGGEGCGSVCSDHGQYRPSSNTCQCDAYYSGSNCDIACSGHGYVRNGTCKCDDFYTGSECNQICSGRGTIQHNICACSSAMYSGRFCQFECSSHGRIVNGSCACDAGYLGPNCEKVCNENGQIVNGTCSCYGHGLITGSTCQTFCHDNGRLVIWNQNGVWSDFTDYKHFEILYQQGRNPRLHCICEGIYGGEDCSLPCSGQGTLRSTGECSCYENVTGVACDRVCNGRGFRDSSGSCVCTSPGTSGPNCETVCSGNGEVSQTTNECVCTEGYKPPYCQAQCDTLCHHGTCTLEDCECDEGWGDTWCHHQRCTNVADDDYLFAQVCPDYLFQDQLCHSFGSIAEYPLLLDLRGMLLTDNEKLQLCMGMGFDNGCIAMVEGGMCFSSADMCDRLGNGTKCAAVGNGTFGHLYRFQDFSTTNHTSSGGGGGGRSSNGKVKRATFAGLIILFLILICLGIFYFYVYIPDCLKRRGNRVVSEKLWKSEAS